MPRPLSDGQVLSLRMRSQWLTGRRATDVRDVVGHMGGLQAQAAAPARLAVRPRGAGLDARAVTRACNEERSVVRTWAMRGTLHMVAADDVGWLVALLGPRFAAADRRRRLQLGLDEGVRARGLEAIGEVLAGGRPRTRAELVRELAGKGVAIDAEGQAPAHLVAYAAMRGLVCRGPDLPGDEPTYVLLKDWVGARPELDLEAALAELARRYVGAYGPAGAADLAAWSGIPLGQARRGLELVTGELEEVEVAGERAWVAGGVEPDVPGVEDPCVRLLGQFDAYLLGYRSRELALPSRFARRIQAGGGLIQPAVVVDGRVVGTWRQRRGGRRLTVTVEPFERLDRAILPGLEAEAADVGRFLGTETALAVTG